MGAYVYTIERQKVIFDETKKLFERLGLSIASKYGDGHAGWTDFAPFDGIVITCGANEVPKNLLNQLKIGGKMVVPIGEGVQTMTRIIRLSETEYETTTHGVFRLFLCCKLFYGFYCILILSISTFTLSMLTSFVKVLSFSIELR